MPRGVFKNPVERAKKISIIKLKRKKELGYINSPETCLKMKIAKINFYKNGGVHPKGSLNKHWNLSVETIKKRTGSNSPLWKGDNVKPHTWIIKKRGKASNYKCVICNIKQGLNWSNKNHKYKKILKDWQSLCEGCHIKWDIKHNNRKINQYC